MKAIVLAGGYGTRLCPLTAVVNKHLLPVFDKPMIYYPLATALRLGIREILIISTPEALPAFNALLGNGSHLGISISYSEQSQPKGIGEAFILGREFIDSKPVCLLLGDNVLLGPQQFFDSIAAAIPELDGALILTRRHKHAERYGVAHFDSDDRVISFEEKPSGTMGEVVAGVYFCDPAVVEIATGTQPSIRNEIEILEVLRGFTFQRIQARRMPTESVHWFDCGQADELLEVSNHIALLQREDGALVSSPELIAVERGLVDPGELKTLHPTLAIKSDYNMRLRALLGAPALL